MSVENAYEFFCDYHFVTDEEKEPFAAYLQEQDMWDEKATSYMWMILLQAYHSREKKE